MDTDFLIVGQGLAGSLLAWELIERGQRVLVVDRDEAVTSSKIAAGIVTPVTGKRIAPSWRLAELHAAAEDFYRRVETVAGKQIYHRSGIARLLANEAEAERWKKRLAENGGAFPEHSSPLQIDDSVFDIRHGGFEMESGGWLDVPEFLEITRQRLLERASYAIADLHAEEVMVNAEGIRWMNVKAGAAVFCQGWEGNRNRFFDWMKYRSAKGEILDLEFSENFSGNRIINRAGWLLPAGGGRYRAGSTYEWEFGDSEACESTSKGREEIESKISSMFAAKAPASKVVGHRAAVRPIIRESRAVIGCHPAADLHDRVAFFNGRGSKGVLNGPFFARQLVEHLVNGSPIDEEVDLRRND